LIVGNIGVIALRAEIISDHHPEMAGGWVVCRARLTGKSDRKWAPFCVDYEKKQLP